MLISNCVANLFSGGGFYRVSQAVYWLPSFCFLPKFV